MITFKCKMCGGDLKIQEGEAVCECEFCGTRQTIPQADSEKKTNLFNRANRLRMSSEFDKAAAVYASITAEFPEEAEAYWGLCLCKYGIEYVDDPATGRKIPTCHRTLPESVMEDGDFEQACENADPVAKRLYREEAKEIDRLQRRILAIVANEQPYDAFICYKETDEDGERTEDSVLAQDIYDALTGKGLKVFFSRITLEDKLGQEYEPYIYAALHSARVLLAVGTKFEYYDAVWVKNEWARFLDMMKTDREKALIPCYKGLDAYDMPKEFRNLQGQDMGKLGWLQDLTRGVIKLCGKENNPQAQQTDQNAYSRNTNPTIDGLLHRAMISIEDQQWDEARQCADRVLDYDAENGRAYLVRLMADLQVTKVEAIPKMGRLFDDNINYKRIIRFGDRQLASRLEEYLSVIRKEKEDVKPDVNAFRIKGNTVKFGRYKQWKNHGGFNTDAIEWTVLDVKGGKALLLSRDGLDVKPYNTEQVSVTWETCTLRNWLNREFLLTAFSEKEQSAILATAVDNSFLQKYGGWKAKGGNNTLDKIFLLSYSEANGYLKVKLTYRKCNNLQSRIKPTDWALQNGAYKSPSKDWQTADGAASGVWWLRSPGDQQDQAAGVSIAGNLSYYKANFIGACIRPAMWLDLNSDVF